MLFKVATSTASVEGKGRLVGRVDMVVVVFVVGLGLFNLGEEAALFCLTRFNRTTRLFCSFLSRM